MGAILERFFIDSFILSKIMRSASSSVVPRCRDSCINQPIAGISFQIILLLTVTFFVFIAGVNSRLELKLVTMLSANP